MIKTLERLTSDLRVLLINDSDINQIVGDRVYLIDGRYLPSEVALPSIFYRISVRPAYLRYQEAAIGGAAFEIRSSLVSQCFSLASKISSLLHEGRAVWQDVKVVFELTAVNPPAYNTLSKAFILELSFQVRSLEVASGAK